MRIVFMGSAALACASLDTLLANDEDDVVGVITQPDSQSGRGRKVQASPVGKHIAGRKLNVLTPPNVNTAENLNTLRELNPELVVVVAYGQILKKELLSIPPKGCINVHHF